MDSRELLYDLFDIRTEKTDNGKVCFVGLLPWTSAYCKAQGKADVGEIIRELLIDAEQRAKCD